MYILSGGAISWSSKLQPTGAATTSEAEYMAAAQAFAGVAVSNGLGGKQVTTRVPI